MPSDDDISRETRDPELEQLAVRVAESRASAIASLERDGEADELRQSARHLGAALAEAADNDKLWERLATSGKSLTEGERVKLRMAVDVDWSWLLDRVGYEPPPPSEVEAAELADALRDALDARDRPSAHAAREKVRRLAHQLTDLGGDERVERSRLRVWLRRGVRVAGKLATAVGAVAAAGEALGVPVSAGVELVLAAVGVLDLALDRVFGAEEDAEAAVERSALRVTVVDFGRVGAALADWRLLRDHPEVPKEPPVEHTLEFIEAALGRVYLIWDVAIGASWSDDEVLRLSADVARELSRARAELGRGREGDLEVLVKALEAGLSAWAALAARLGPLTPKDG
jgi:hypothetical protein